MQERYDIAFVGCGLANALLALRLAEITPPLRMIMIDAENFRSSGKTWSYFLTDLRAEDDRFLAPFCSARWKSYDVRFPGITRTLSTGYASISGASLMTAVRKLADEGRITLVSGKVDRMSADSVAFRADLSAESTSEPRFQSARDAPGGLSPGSGPTAAIDATCVVDGRGFVADNSLDLGYQKFVGWTVVLSEPHGLSAPTLMDACVEQFDDYRFMYVLPFDEHRVLIEDTRYSINAELDTQSMRVAINAYARSRGWTIAQFEGEEFGILPVVMGGGRQHSDHDVAVIGTRADLFHPTTSYSLPDAVRLADTIARLPAITTAAVAAVATNAAQTAWRQRGFYRLLNRLLFRAAKPGCQFAVFERFYRLSQPLIERFYAAKSTPSDRLRILIGRPPVPIFAALANLGERHHTP